MTFGIMALSMKALYQYAEWPHAECRVLNHCYAECRYTEFVILNVVMLNVVAPT